MYRTVFFQIPSSIEITSPGINYLTLSIVSLNQIAILLELQRDSQRNDIADQTNDFVNFVQDLHSSVDSKSTDSKILSSGSLGDSFLATYALSITQSSSDSESDDSKVLSNWTFG
ncbi:hypothetical protein L2E82_17745 [Cichorium intybus]|uniref:Uncharacterized protein n=1 Tax=Cichorium intybus TaxID=13427 RepID=A0ACB9F8A6_CICIN|nr:hypothetical protein L2E82_17745 [Cichorium intybus]